jgi:hypothetical protein
MNFEISMVFELSTYMLTQIKTVHKILIQVVQNSQPFSNKIGVAIRHPCSFQRYLIAKKTIKKRS